VLPDAGDPTKAHLVVYVPDSARQLHVDGGFAEPTPPVWA
jgi:hypothetical protein